MKTRTNGTSHDLPVRTRRTVEPGGETSTHRTVYCARREDSIAVSTCLTCSKCDGLRFDTDRMAVTCSHEDAGKAAPSTPSLCRFSSDAERTPLSDIMSGDVVCVRPDLSLAALRSLLAGQSFSGAPVVDDQGRAIGVVSQTDLVRADLSSAHATAYDVMMPMAFTLQQNASVAQAAALMAYEGIHRVPVVSSNGTVVGIVSTLDIVRWLAEHDGYVVRHGA